MQAIALALVALLPPLAFAQDVQERLEPPTGSEWRALQERNPVQPPAKSDALSLRFYDVSDVSAAARGLEPPASREERLQAGVSMETILEEEQARAAEADRLGELLASFVRPPLEGEQKIEGTGTGVLVVQATAAQHEWLSEVLDHLRRQAFQAPHYRVESRFIEAPRGAFREHLPPGTAAFLEDAEARARFLALVDQQGFDYGLAPEVLLRGAQHATLAVMEEVPYVAKYELVVVQPSGQEIADPVIEVLEEGYSLDMRVLPLPGEQLGLELALTRAWIERPIPTRKIRLSAAIDTEVEVAAPVSHRADVRSRLLLSPGAAVVFLTPSNDEGRDLAVVVSVEPVLLTGSAR